MEHSHGVDVFILCNTISSTRILSCFVKRGHCFLLFQVFTSGLCFPSSRGGDGVSAGGPWARHSAVRGSEPLPSFPRIHAPLRICPVSQRRAPWPLRSPPPPPEQFLLHFLNPGMNPGRPGSPESRCPHSRCSLQIGRLPMATPHTWRCHCRAWQEPPGSPSEAPPAQPARSLQLCSGSELAWLPQATLCRAAWGPLAPRSCAPTPATEVPHVKDAGSTALTTGAGRVPGNLVHLPLFLQ